MKWLNKLKPIFTVKQFERLSNIFDNAGQGILVVTVLSPLVVGFDKANYIIVVSGIIVVLASWLCSVWLARKSEA